MNLKNLSRFLPGFSRKPRSPKPQPAPASSVAATVTQPPAAPAPIPEPAKPTKPSRMLDDVCAFLARYLHCSYEQRTVLALWVLHTHSFPAARSTPYLAIQSSRKLAGKSLCLRLLSLLSAHPALTSGVTASALVHRIHSHPNELPAFLLDESPATVGSRSRARNPKLRAILVSGFQPGIGYSDRSFECTIFSPKAFASLGPLPEALADCSIPIVLQPMRDPEQSGIERFDLLTAQQEAQPLVAALQNWARKNISALKSAPALKYKDFPQRLTWRGQDLVEPLLQIADQVGGDYPARARQSLLHLFDDPARQQQDIAIQLLRDLRDCFKFHGNPERLATAVFLEWLHGLPSRPWDLDGPITGRKFANLLAPFAVRPRFQRMGKTSSARGYQLQDFVPLWQKHLDVEIPVAVDSGQGLKAKAEEQISINKDACCSAVAHSGTTQNRVAQPSEAQDSGVAVALSQGPLLGSAGLRAETSVTGAEKSVGNSGHLRGGERSDKTNDPRIEGMLDDPYNYFRQYPDEHIGKLRYLIEDRQKWPQPADDELPPDEVFRMPDGARIPFTLINRHPTNPKPILGLPQFWTQRWPVMLNNKERLQVATARFYELLAAKAAMEEKQKEAASNREQVSSAVS